MMDKYRKGFPIIIGLAGKAGSGKTSVAEKICPKASVVITDSSSIAWQHIFYALPLYEIASIKKSIRGINERSRKMYAIHDVLYDLYGGTPIGFAPDYDVLTRMVTHVESMPIEPEGIKPRDFLQRVGDLCREHRATCFSEWAIMQSSKMHRRYVSSFADESLASPYAIIISDVRLENEADSILRQPNGVVIVFDASEETLNNRIIKRDGRPLSEEHRNHSTEKQIDIIKQKASFVLNTDHMSLEEQTSSTIKLITNTP